FLMRKSAEVVLQRERAWSEELSARNAQLIQTARELEESVRMHDAMVAGVTHDLRTPLTVITVQAQLLRRQVTRGSLEERIGSNLELIVRAAARMARWIDELLDASRMHSVDELELNLECVDLLELVRDVVSIHQVGTARHRLELRTDAVCVRGEWDAA